MSSGQNARSRTELVEEITALRTGAVRQAGAEEILSVVNTIIDAMNRDLPAMDVAVRDDLEDLAAYIRLTKSEIMELSPEEISEEHVPTAAVELDAIVEATESATHAIMEAAEQIESVTPSVGAEQETVLSGATTQIYEACSFQDITGQRISKVIDALHNIESKVDALVAAFGVESEEEHSARVARRTAERERLRQEAADSGDLCEGPQMPGDAISQDDIDALFDKL